MKTLILVWVLIVFYQNVRANTIEAKYNHDSLIFEFNYCYHKAPAYLKANSSSLVNKTSRMFWISQSHQQKKLFTKQKVYLPKGIKGCLKHEMDLTKESHPKTSKRFKRLHPESMIVAIDQLLMVPSDQDYRSLPQINVHHNQQVQISAPWKLVERSDTQTQYQIKPSPKYAEGYIAIGPLQHQQIAIGDSILRLAIMYGNNPHKNEIIGEWVQQMAQSVAQLTLAFPLQDLQVLVVLIEGSSGAVPWGKLTERVAKVYCLWLIQIIVKNCYLKIGRQHMNSVIC